MIFLGGIIVLFLILALNLCFKEEGFAKGWVFILILWIFSIGVWLMFSTQETDLWVAPGTVFMFTDDTGTDYTIDLNEMTLVKNNIDIR